MEILVLRAVLSFRLPLVVGLRAPLFLTGAFVLCEELSGVAKAVRVRGGRLARF